MRRPTTTYSWYVRRSRFQDGMGRSARIAGQQASAGVGGACPRERRALVREHTGEKRGFSDNGAVSFPGALAGDRACTLVAQRPSRVLFLVQCFLRCWLLQSLDDRSLDVTRRIVNTYEHDIRYWFESKFGLNTCVYPIHHIMHTITNNRRKSRFARIPVRPDRPSREETRDRTTWRPDRPACLT